MHMLYKHMSTYVILYKQLFMDLLICVQILSLRVAFQAILDGIMPGNPGAHEFLTENGGRSAVAYHNDTSVLQVHFFWFISWEKLLRLPIIYKLHQLSLFLQFQWQAKSCEELLQKGLPDEEFMTLAVALRCFTKLRVLHLRRVGIGFMRKNHMYIYVYTIWLHIHY